MSVRRLVLPLLSLLVLLLVGCAGTPERPEELRRQALLGLGESAARRVLEAPPLPQPPTDQVLLLAMPEVDAALSIGRERLHESLARALLGISQGPQVLDWRDDMAEGAGGNQWRLQSHLAADGPRLRLSDREMLPYRLELSLYRPDGDAPLWETQINGAFDVTAL